MRKILIGEAAFYCAILITLSYCHKKESSPPTASPPPTARPISFLFSPGAASTGSVLRVLVVSEDEAEKARISISGPGGELAVAKLRSGGGPPFWWSAECQPAADGQYTVWLESRNTILASRKIMVPSAPPSALRTGPVWKSEAGWSGEVENLYSAWIDRLFQDDDERSVWDAFHKITQDPERNFLFNHLGLNEDDSKEKDAVIMQPDCADNPYFLRAYFSWKLRLPFGLHECSRGYLGKAPECGRWWTNSMQRTRSDELRAFNIFLRLIMNAIHSGSARTGLRDEISDYYPLPLDRKNLRPGVVYADPHGHTLIIVKWIPQTQKRPGQLLALDAQPDGTIAIKRFWKGNFLFATQDVIGAPGFKAFRPIILDGEKPRLLRNKEILENKDYANYSLQQDKMESAAFYDAMERLINPQPLDAKNALTDLFRAFHEQLIVRVQSVANGEEYMKSHPGTIIPMPGGAAVFQATGLWEDYSTPNRDLRLLIAMDTILEFPKKASEQPEAYHIAGNKAPDEIRKELEALHDKLASELTITYKKTDGLDQVLTLAEALKRQEAFEIAYNPNDAIEIRWGAPEGSPEFASGRRRAPGSQRAKMQTLRHWFRKRLHPPT